MIYDRHSKERSKWNKSSCERGDYAATICNITDEVIEEYILTKIEEIRKQIEWR